MEKVGFVGGLEAMRRIARLIRDQKAATAVEYGLICAMIFLAAIGAIRMVGTTTINMWDGVSDNVFNEM